MTCKRGFIVDIGMFTAMLVQIYKGALTGNIWWVVSYGKPMIPCFFDLRGSLRVQEDSHLLNNDVDS